MWFITWLNSVVRVFYLKCSFLKKLVKMPTNNYDKVSNEDIGYWGNRIGSEYMDLAKNLYNKNINSEISNSSLDHAMLLSFLLIRKSQDKIRIFTKKMNETFFRNPEIRREI